MIRALLSVLCDDYSTEDLKKLLGAVDKIYQRENINVLYVLNKMFSKESANSASGKAVKALISMLAEGGAPATVAEKWSFFKKKR